MDLEKATKKQLIIYAMTDRLMLTAKLMDVLSKDTKNIQLEQDIKESLLYVLDVLSDYSDFN